MPRTRAVIPGGTVTLRIVCIIISRLFYYEALAVMEQCVLNYQVEYSFGFDYCAWGVLKGCALRIVNDLNYAVVRIVNIGDRVTHANFIFYPGIFIGGKPFGVFITSGYENYHC